VAKIRTMAMTMKSVVRKDPGVMKGGESVVMRKERKEIKENGVITRSGRKSEEGSVIEQNVVSGNILPRLSKRSLFLA